MKRKTAVPGGYCIFLHNYPLVGAIGPTPNSAWSKVKEFGRVEVLKELGYTCHKILISWVFEDSSYVKM